MRLIRAHDPDVIVSTYPGVTAMLGELRRKGQAEGPLLLLDHRSRGPALLGAPRHRPALHHPSRVDRGGRSRSPGRAASAGPSRRPRRRSWRPRSRADARRALGLPADGTGDRRVRRRLGRRRPGRRDRAALAVPDAIVLVPVRAQRQSCGPRVAKRFADEPRLRLMGFTDRMGDVLAAADALVHSSAGLTVLEAIIRGCPVDLLRLRRRARAREQPRARALRAGAGRALARASSGPRCERALRAPSRARRLVRAPALDRRR